MRNTSRWFMPVVVMVLAANAAPNANAQSLDRFGVVGPSPAIGPLSVRPAPHCPPGQHMNEAGTSCVPNVAPVRPEPLPRPGAELQIRKQATARATQAVKVRSGPGTAYPRIWTLQPDIVVSVGQCGSGWCQIGGPQGNGWVAATHLRFGG